MEIYFLTDKSLETFIADSFMSTAIRDCGSMFHASRFRNKFDAIQFLAGSGTTLSKKIYTKVSAYYVC